MKQFIRENPFLVYGAVFFALYMVYEIARLLIERGC